MRKIIICILALLAFSIGCRLPQTEQNKILDSRKIDAETMENILYEVYLSDGIVSLQMIKLDSYKHTTQYYVDSMIYENVYAKYDTSKEALEESVLWYLQNDTETLRTIYSNIVERLNKELSTKEPSNEKAENTL